MKPLGVLKVRVDFGLDVAMMSERALSIAQRSLLVGALSHKYISDIVEAQV